jgi:hypothetical protein
MIWATLPRQVERGTRRDRRSHHDLRRNAAVPADACRIVWADAETTHLTRRRDQLEECPDGLGGRWARQDCSWPVARAKILAGGCRIRSEPFVEQVRAGRKKLLGQGGMG